MQVRTECPEHGWHDHDLGDDGFAVLVKPGELDDDISTVAGPEHEWTQVTWCKGGDVYSMDFGDVPEQVVSDNGRGDPDDVIVNISVEPSDEELDAWLNARFGEDPATYKPYKPRVGHKFNLVFARALIAFGRSFT